MTNADSLRRYYSASASASVLRCYREGLTTLIRDGQAVRTAPAGGCVCLSALADRAGLTLAEAASIEAQLAANLADAFG